MRGARTLYAVHLGVAFSAVALVGAAAIVVLTSSDLGVASGAAISDACAKWLAMGGPPAILGLVVTGLAAAVALLSARSAVRHLRAGHAYLSRLPVGAQATIDGTRCRLVETGEALAFCAGYLRPRIYLSLGLIEGLSADELRAVVAHERHHRQRRDPLRRLLARVLADGLFFIPMLRRSSERYTALGELAADEAAVAALENRRPLAGALLKLSGREPVPAPAVGIDAERVDQLLGERTVGRWRLSRAMTTRSALALIALVGLLVATSVVRPGLDWPIVLGAGCMAAMIGAPLTAFGAVALAGSQRR